MAQWKRAGPITQRSGDRNLALLEDFFRINETAICPYPPLNAWDIVLFVAKCCCIDINIHKLCVSVCVHVYMFICVYMCVFVCICVYMYLCVCVYMSVRVHVGIVVFKGVCILCLLCLVGVCCVCVYVCLRASVCCV